MISLLLLLQAQDVVFDASPPHSDAEEVQARFRNREKPGPYDVKKEKFRVYVPASHKAGETWGLLIYINPGDGAGLPAGYEALLEKRKLLGISPYKAGNERPAPDRFRLAIDAGFNMHARFKVDPERVYVSGFSGGGRIASMLGVAYADLFAGAIPLCGANFYTDIPSEPGKHWPRNYIPVDEALKIAKAGSRFVLMTGEKDTNLANTRAVHEHGFKKEGFRRAELIVVPGLGHAPPPAADFAKALDFVDRR